jgi:hypothetical protein
MMITIKIEHLPTENKIHFLASDPALPRIVAYDRQPALSIAWAAIGVKRINHDERFADDQPQPRYLWSAVCPFCTKLHEHEGGEFGFDNPLDVDWLGIRTAPCALPTANFERRAYELRAIPCEINRVVDLLLAERPRRKPAPPQLDHCLFARRGAV